MRFALRCPARLLTLTSLLFLSACGGSSGGGVVITLGSVLALFTNAPDWNDYVQGDNYATSGGAACNAATDTACVHGGEIKMVEVSGPGSCTGLTAEDNLGAFDWVCDDSTATVRFISTGLKDGKHLSDLIDFTAAEFTPNAVSISNNGTVVDTTASEVWWGNLFGFDNTGGTIGPASKIVLVTADATSTYNITFDKVAIVVKPGVTTTGPATASAVIEASSQNYLWIEGEIDATGDAHGINLDSVKFSRLRNLSVDNAFDGIVILSSPSISLTDVAVNNNTNDGLVLESADQATLTKISAMSNGRAGVILNSLDDISVTDIDAVDNDDYGLIMFTTTNSMLSDIRISGSSIMGLREQGGSMNVLNNIVAVNNTNGIVIEAATLTTLMNSVAVNNDVGIFVAAATNNALSNIRASNNSTAGIQIAFGSTKNMLSNIITDNNRDGIILENSSANSLLDVTSVNNSFSGVFLNGATNNVLANVATNNNNSVGTYLFNGSNNQVILNLASDNNSLSVNLESSSATTLANVAAVSYDLADLDVNLDMSSNNIFTGLLQVDGDVSADCSVTGGTSPGLDNNCASSATLISNIDLINSFVGSVLQDDPANTSDDAGGQATFPLDPNVFDWSQFDNRYRSWRRVGATAADEKSSWTTGDGEIVDWSISMGDNGNAGNPALLNVLPLTLSGNLNDIIIHEWDIPGATNTTACGTDVPGSRWSTALGSCFSEFVRNAVEIAGDNIGNDNVLCEDDEACLYTPNIGSYQGHGNLISAGTFSNGNVTGVTMMKYDSNGR